MKNKWLVLGSAILLGLFVKQFKADEKILKMLNLIFCIAAFVFILVGFIISLEKGMIQASGIMSDLTLLILPCVGLVISFNLD